MKKILITLLSLGVAGITLAQTLQASIGAGSASNKVKVYVKSSSAVANTNISTLQFNLGILNTINPKPTINITPNNTNFPSVTWQVNTADEGGFYNFKLTTPVAPIIVTSLNTTSEVEVMEVEFVGGQLGLHDVSLVSLPGGGSDAQVLFLCTGVPSSEGTNLYFTRNGTVVTNGNTYEGADVSKASIGNIALPVKFLSFYAIKNGDDAKLNWTVENDIDNKFFELERSLDGKNFRSFNSVKASANGRPVNTYEATDSKLSAFGKPTVYYRIKQVDNNGEVLYSQIRSVSTDRNGMPVSLFPNPARTTTKLVIDVDRQVQGSVIIRDMGGKVVKQTNTVFLKGVNQQNLQVAELASGEYNVTVVAGDNNYVLKLTKIN